MYSELEFISAINTNQKIIHKVCNMYMPNAGGREDLFQEIVLNAWKGIKNFKGDSKFSTWLYRVALNTAITFYRKEKRTIETSSLDSPLEIAPDISASQEDSMNAMYRAIAELSDIDKAIVMLYLEDYSYQEIGDIIGITVNNTAVKMNRIKTKLKESSKKYL